METCSNCGAALRPDARFCTTCGARLNAKTDSTNSWGTPHSTSESQQTAVMPTIPVDPPTTPPPTTLSVQGRTRDWGAPAGSNGSDPASRFIDALDKDVKPLPEDPIPAPTSQQPAESTWVTPAPDAFAPPPTWSFQQAEDEKSAESSFDTWRAPSTWTTDEAQEDEASHDDAPPAGEKDAATVADAKETAEESSTPPSTPEAVTGTDEPATADEILSPDDARARAIALADELRAVLRQVPAGGNRDEGTAAMTLTEASLQVSDYDDVRDVIATVQDDPRDIQALTALAAKVDRLEALLGEHAMLHAAIEEAIGELSGD